MQMKGQEIKHGKVVWYQQFDKYLVLRYVEYNDVAPKKKRRRMIICFVKLFSSSLSVVITCTAWTKSRLKTKSHHTQPSIVSSSSNHLTSRNKKYIDKYNFVVCFCFVLFLFEFHVPSFFVVVVVIAVFVGTNLEIWSGSLQGTKQ